MHQFLEHFIINYKLDSKICIISNSPACIITISQDTPLTSKKLHQLKMEFTTMEFLLRICLLTYHHLSSIRLCKKIFSFSFLLLDKSNRLEFIQKRNLVKVKLMFVVLLNTSLQRMPKELLGSLIREV